MIIYRFHLPIFLCLPPYLTYAMARLTPRTRLSVHATYDASLQQQVKSSIKSPANTVHLISHRHHHPIALIRYLYPDTIYLSFETVRSIHDLKFTRELVDSFLPFPPFPRPSLRDSVLKGDPLEARYSNKPRQVEAWHASLVTHCGYAQDAGAWMWIHEDIVGGIGIRIYRV